MSGTIMETHKEYKQNNSRSIPVGWEVKKLGSLCSIKGQYGINAAAVDFDPNLPTYFRITDISDYGGFDESKKKSVDDRDASQYILEKDDIVFARTGATVGKTYLHNRDDLPLVFAGFLIRFRANKSLLCHKFLKHYTESSKYWKWVKVTSVRSGQPGINGKEYSSFPIILPPLPEQKAIANCLNTWDEAINNQTQLIKNKQAYKKALMQQLLTGKKRLKGFSGDWEEKLISDLFVEITKKNDRGLHEPLSISAGKGFVSQKEKFDRVIAGTSLSKYIQLEKGDFSYNKGNSKKYKMGCIYLLESFETALVPFVFISFRPTNKINPHFYKHFFSQYGLDRQLKRIITSGARGDGLLNVSKKDFFKLLVPFPSKKEQTSIAKILNNADKEITLLQNQLNQLELQKKGLMQQLLTGKKRLKIQ